MPEWLRMITYFALVLASAGGIQQGLRMTVKDPDGIGPTLFWVGLFALFAAFAIQLDLGTRISIGSPQSQS